MALARSIIRTEIEKVVDPDRQNEDWATLLKICDDIAKYTESAEWVIELIGNKLRISSSAKEWRSVELILTLLETLVHNCGPMLHIYLAGEEFLQCLKSVIARKKEPPLQVQTRVLRIIQDWAQMFKNDPSMAIIQELYESCQEQGYEFPPSKHPSSTQAAASIATQQSISKSLTNQSKKRSTGDSRPKTAAPRLSNDRATMDEQTAQHSNRSLAIKYMSEMELVKLCSELDVVHGNLNVFEAMLGDLEPGREHPEDWSLFVELYATCQKMQARIVALLSLVAIEDVAVQLLRCNDRLNKLFKEFKRYLRERESAANASAPVYYDQKEDESEVPKRLNSARKSSRPKMTEDEGENKTNRRTSLAHRTSSGDEDSQERQILPSPQNLLPINDNDQKRNKSNRIQSSTHEPMPLPALRGTRMDDQSLMAKRLNKLDLEPMPDSELNSDQKMKMNKRNQSAIISGRRNKSNYPNQIFDESAEVDSEPELNIEQKEKPKQKSQRPVEARNYSMRATRLSSDGSANSSIGYKITDYHRLE